MKNKGGKERGGGLINFSPLKRGGLIREGDLLERVGGEGGLKKVFTVLLILK